MGPKTKEVTYATNWIDDNRQAIINPEDLNEPLEGFPKIAVSCFSRSTFQRMLEMFPHELIYENVHGECGYSDI